MSQREIRVGKLVGGGVEGHAHRGAMSPKRQGRSVSSGGEYYAPAMEKGRGPSEPVSNPAHSPFIIETHSKKEPS